MKLPRQLELGGEMLGERLDADRLGRVVPGVKHVQTQFLRQCEGPVRPLARHERINTLRRRLPEFAAGASGEN